MRKLTEVLSDVHTITHQNFSPRQVKTKVKTETTEEQKENMTACLSYLGQRRSKSSEESSSHPWVFAQAFPVPGNFFPQLFSPDAFPQEAFPVLPH